MVNWKSLKPLKTHSTILGVIVLVLIAILIFTPRHVFRMENGNSNSFMEANEGSSIVTAISGLSIRDQPSTKGNLLTTAPYQAKLIVLEQILPTTT